MSKWTVAPAGAVGVPVCAGQVAHLPSVVAPAASLLMAVK